MNRGLVFLLLLLLVVGGAIYYWAANQRTLSLFKFPVIPGTKLNIISQQFSEQIQPALHETQPLVNSLTTEGEKVASRAAAVLGATVGISDSASQPATLIEGTAQYARYWYCKQVVDQYELQYQPN